MINLGMAWSFLLRLVLISCILGIHVDGSPTMHKEGCPSSYGGVNISYPFGVEDGCFYNEYFKLRYNNSSNSMKLFGAEVMDIATEPPQIKVSFPVVYRCYGNSSISYINYLVSLKEIPYRISYTENVFTAVGCDTWALITGIRVDYNYTGGCISTCSSEKDVSDGNCSGIGCCQTNIPEGLLNFRTSFRSEKNHSGVKSFNPCSYSFIVEKSKYNFITADLNMTKNRKFPVVLDWVIGKNSCEEAKMNTTDYACVSDNSECDNSLNFRPGYYCKCSEGYYGNPYLEDGCQDIDECMEFPCAEGGICKNAKGSYSCTCPSGTEGDPYKDGCYKAKINLIAAALVGGLSIGTSLLIFTGCCILIYKRSKKSQKKKLRRKNFNLNNKQLEMELISSHGDTTERIKTFTLKEMEKATNQFDKTRIIGEGGHGTVYKGLLSDQRVTAIKASKVMNQREKEEFINEVALLSRIYHRNVVMLYGCCLETEVPLLAYEFISNGTLSDHLHVRGPDPSSYLCWADRLRIATEVSAAIAYLHSATLKTIFHRDLKSANILLDERLTAKISDFGASKFIGTDQTHITATIQGTIGYLDPEYFQSGKLTEKSDVYSLGVILVELLTGEKPISNARSQEERIIIMHFIRLLNENQVEQILDTRVVKEAPKEEIEVFARLAGSCLRFKGEERPAMKEVVSTLEGIKSSKRKKKDQILDEEAKHILSFDISSTENSSWSTTRSFAIN